MPMVSVEYEYAVPNQFYTDHSFSEGKMRSTTYDGPDKIYLIVDQVTGIETHGPLTAEEKADGRPVPLGSMYYEIDCVENPLFCQLRGHIIDEAEEDHTHAVIHPDSPDLPGYKQLTYQEPILPRNIYDKMNTRINLETGEITIPVFTPLEALFGGAMKQEVTWDYVRRKRNKELENCDPKVGGEIPASVQAPWLEYRRLLRELPDVLKDVPPAIVIRMFPTHPGENIMPEGVHEQTLI